MLCCQSEVIFIADSRTSRVPFICPWQMIIKSLSARAILDAVLEAFGVKENSNGVASKIIILNQCW